MTLNRCFLAIIAILCIHDGYIQAQPSLGAAVSAISSKLKSATGRLLSSCSGIKRALLSKAPALVKFGSSACTHFKKHAIGYTGISLALVALGWHWYSYNKQSSLLEEAHDEINNLRSWRGDAENKQTETEKLLKQAQTKVDEHEAYIEKIKVTMHALNERLKKTDLFKDQKDLDEVTALWVNLE